MRAISILALMLCLAYPAWGELSQGDLERIGELMDRKLGPLKIAVARLEGKLSGLEGKMDGLEQRMEGLEKTVDAFRKEMDARINALDAKMVSKQWFLTMWVTITLMILAVPYLYGRSDRDRVRELERQVRDVSAELERMKAIREEVERIRRSAQAVVREKPELEDAYRAIGVL